MNTPEGSDKNDLPTEQPADTSPDNGGGAPTNGNVNRRPAGGIVTAGLSAGGGVPSGLFTNSLGLQADISNELAELAPTFSDVLLSIGTGVAESQAAFDQGLVDTATHLSKTKIEVVTDVIQELDDDGLPSIDQTTLVTKQVALINYMRPAAPRWKQFAVSMDVTVGAMDNESGMSFSQTQINTTGGGAYIWNFGGWFAADIKQSSQAGYENTQTNSNWSRGKMLVDGLMETRETSSFPVPAEIVIGPSITFSQGSVKEVKNGQVVTARSVEILISVRKTDGSVNPNVPLEADTDRFALSWEDSTSTPNSPFTGSTTNSAGQCKLKITRDIPSPAFLRPVKVVYTVTLGQFMKTGSAIL